jgi:hypothetical protein
VQDLWGRPPAEILGLQRLGLLRGIADIKTFGAPRTSG